MSDYWTDPDGIVRYGPGGNPVDLPLAMARQRERIKREAEAVSAEHGFIKAGGDGTFKPLFERPDMSEVDGEPDFTVKVDVNTVRVDVNNNITQEQAEEIKRRFRSGYYDAYVPTVIVNSHREFEDDAEIDARTMAIWIAYVIGFAMGATMATAVCVILGWAS